MNTIQQQWEAFEAAIIPKDAPKTQRQEMRRAFYAGAEYMLDAYLDIKKSSDCAALTAALEWYEEFQAFAKAVQQYCANHVSKTCANCRHFEQDFYYYSSDGECHDGKNPGTGEDAKTGSTNLRCIIGKFSVKETDTCKMYHIKSI